MEKRLKAVIFDLDGVITDTSEFHYLAWKHLANELGISIDRVFNEQLKGISRQESLEKILVQGNRENDFSKVDKERLAEQKNRHYVELIGAIGPENILPGMKSFIDDVKKSGLKLGVASASKNAGFVLAQLNLTDDFDQIVDAAKIKSGKPNPEIFLTAAKLLEVDPKECIGIEDAEAGIQSIKSAGMFAVGIGSNITLSNADLVFNNSQSLNFKIVRDSFYSMDLKA